MQRRITWTALALAAALAGPVGAEETKPQPLALGAPAPAADVDMRGVDGRDYSIAAVAGRKGTLVLFSCNTCPWVVAWEPRIVELGNRLGRRGVGVIVINSNDPGLAPGDGFDAMVARARALGMAFPYVVDGGAQVARAFGATRTPEAFLFDAAGRLVYHGAIDDNAKEPGKVKSRYLADAVNAVVGGRAVKTARTKALGCMIKYPAPAKAES